MPGSGNGTLWKEPCAKPDRRLETEADGRCGRDPATGCGLRRPRGNGGPGPGDERRPRRFANHRRRPARSGYFRHHRPDNNPAFYYHRGDRRRLIYRRRTDDHRASDKRACCYRLAGDRRPSVGSDH